MVFVSVLPVVSALLDLETTFCLRNDYAISSDREVFEETGGICSVS